MIGKINSNEQTHMVLNWANETKYIIKEKIIIIVVRAKKERK